MKIKLLKKVRKRFIIQKDNEMHGMYRVDDLGYNLFTMFYSNTHRTTLTSALDWIFEHYHNKNYIIKRRYDKYRKKISQPVKVWYEKS